MHSENAIQIRADRATVFRLAADIATWPRSLSHYWRVRVLHDTGQRRVATMAAWRKGFPVSWATVQELFPDEGRITYRHVGGVSSGMWVEWTLRESLGTTYVRISHDFEPNWPLVGPAAARLIGRLFVLPIAGSTLRQIKTLAEAEVAARETRREP